MLSFYLMGALVVLIAFYIAKKFIRLSEISRYMSSLNNLERLKKCGLVVWRIGVIGYALWLLLNFWKVIIFPATPITLELITNIIFHPPFIQLILAITFAWLIIALLNVPSMHLKGINTPFLKFEMVNVEKVLLQGSDDLVVSRESDESRWIAVSLSTKVNPFSDVDSEIGQDSEIEILAIAMGGIILDAFRTVNEEIEFASGIITIDTGELNDDILYFPPKAQYVIRNAHRENSFYYQDMSLAVPIRFKEIEAIFYLYNSSIKVYKMDCMMVETIWAILLKNIDTTN